MSNRCRRHRSIPPHVAHDEQDHGCVVLQGVLLGLCTVCFPLKTTNPQPLASTKCTMMGIDLHLFDVLPSHIAHLLLYADLWLSLSSSLIAGGQPFLSLKMGSHSLGSSQDVLANYSRRSTLVVISTKGTKS